jgi:glycosyltransferase involved in cell wall biosynthesis
MTHVAEAKTPTILFGVTASQSLKLLGKLPEAMIKRGWEVHVVADNVSSLDLEGQRGLHFHSVPMARRPALVKDLVSLARWTMLVGAVKPDVVAVGTPKAALLGLVSSFFHKVPARIYQLRGLRLETVSGVIKHLLYFLEWLSSRSSTHILAVSPSLKEEYCRLGLSSEEKIRVLGHGSSHGVDITQFNRERWSDWNPPEAELRDAIASRVPILGFVGRLSPDKGSREIFACHSALRESGLPHKLLLVGPIEGKIPMIDGQESNLSDVIFTGAVRNVAPYYSMMDILLLPTYREGFPNVILEAAACKVPAITTDATGAVDSVIHGESGLITKVGSTYSLISAIKYLLADSELRSSMGRNAYERVLRYFDSHTVVEDYANFFTSVVEFPRD